MALSNSHEGSKGREELSQAGWNDLPQELLLRILSFADDHTKIVASGVCREWKQAITSGITKLSLSWCKKNMNDLVLLVSPKFTRLQVLNLRQSIPQIHDNAVEALSNFCHDLREVDLSKCSALTDKSLYTLARGCLNLTRLNISGCTSFSDLALTCFVSCCRGLRYLNLCGCGCAATDYALKAIAHNCKQLQVLNLGWCEDVTDEGIVSLARGCLDLRILDLCGCVRITDESVIALAKGCRRLQSLDLYYCQNITDRAMYALAAYGRRPRSNCEPPDQEDGIAGLTSLNISQCTALTPHAVQVACDSFPSLHTCPGRHSLTMSGCLALASVHCTCAPDHAKRPRGQQS